MEKIVDIIDSIAHEKGLKVEDVTEAIKKAFINTAKKVLGQDLEFDAEIDAKTKTIKVYQKVQVVADDDERAKEHPERYILLSEAKQIDPDVEIGDELRYEVEFEKLGRTAAMRLHQEIEYHIQRLIEDQLFNKDLPLVKKALKTENLVERFESEIKEYIK